MNGNDLPYHMPTSVGERRGSAWAGLFALVAILGTSVLASEVVAWMTHRMHDPMFAGFRVFVGWAQWLLDTINIAAYLSPPYHPAPLTAYGWHVMWTLGITWAIGIGVAIAGWFWITIALDPKWKRDPSQIRDSARMADADDFDAAGFVAK
jgi:hypothetical protein